MGVVSAGGGAADVDMRSAVSGRVAGLDSSDDDSDAGSRKFPAAAVACVGVMESISVAGGSNLDGGDAGSVVACGVDVSLGVVVIVCLLQQLRLLHCLAAWLFGCCLFGCLLGCLASWCVCCLRGGGAARVEASGAGHVPGSVCCRFAEGVAE